MVLNYEKKKKFIINYLKKNEKVNNDSSRVLLTGAYIAEVHKIIL